MITQLSPTATTGKPYLFVAKGGGAAHAGEFTALSVGGTPGARHNFVAKTPESGGGHTGEFTALSVLATPGARHNFVAKTPESGGGHTGEFTALSVSATPGARHTFLPKTPGDGHFGEFTALSVSAIPGARHAFVPKTPYVPDVPVPPVLGGGGGGGGYRLPDVDWEPDRKDKLHAEILRDDEELLEMAAIIMATIGV